MFDNTLHFFRARPHPLLPKRTMPPDLPFVKEGGEGFWKLRGFHPHHDSMNSGGTCHEHCQQKTILEPLSRRRPQRGCFGPLCLGCRQILRGFHHFCPICRPDRKNLCFRASGRDGILYQGDTHDRLAMDVCCGNPHRFFDCRRKLRDLPMESGAGHVGKPIRIGHASSRLGRFSRRLDRHVRGTPCRWVTERSRAERFASAYCEWFYRRDLLLPGRHCHGSDPLPIGRRAVRSGSPQAQMTGRGEAASKHERPGHMTSADYADFKTCKTDVYAICIGMNLRSSAASVERISFLKG
jgi:hypothetical protein